MFQLLVVFPNNTTNNWNKNKSKEFLVFYVQADGKSSEYSETSQARMLKVEGAATQLLLADPLILSKQLQSQLAFILFPKVFLQSLSLFLKRD